MGDHEGHPHVKEPPSPLYIHPRVAHLFIPVIGDV